MRARLWLTAILALPGFLASEALLAQGPGKGPFYNVDNEVRVEATVREIRLEPRYQGTAPFLILEVEEQGSRKAYHVEIAPAWFFGEDVHGGEKVRIVGSLADTPGGTPTIIARELRMRGQTFELRDKRGFPNWQGGPQRRRGIRRFGRP